MRAGMGAGRIPYRMLPRLLPMLLFAIALVVSPTPSQAARAELHPDLVEVVGQGWIYFESGNLDKALAHFTRAYDTDLGKDYAEVYYSLAMVWWERRNALASLRWLDEAIKARKDRLSWRRGPNKEWDRRIDGRRRYILKNFTVVKLRPPDRAAGLPPLADPPPKDPLLRQFTEHVAGIVSDAHREGIYNLWVLLPNGTYWLGEDLLQHGGGEVDMTKAVEWDLPTDRNPLRKSFNRRTAAIDDGASEAAQILRDLADAEAAAQEHAEAVRNQRPLSFTSVAHADTERVAADISASWPLDSFRMSYLVIAESAASEHEVSFPKLGLTVAFEADGRLRVQGRKKLIEDLGSEWRTGLAENPNNVEIVFDGVAVSVTVNGLSFGPLDVRRGKPSGHGTEWMLRVSDDASALRAVEISKCQAPANASVDRGR